MNRGRLALIAAAVLAASGTGTGFAVAGTGGGGSPAPAAASQPASGAAPAVSAAAGTGTPGYSWYRSMMDSAFGRYMGPGMMGRSTHGWMMGQAGYRWMLGTAGRAPGWQRGGSLPGFMMGGSADPGTVMGRLFADAPGPRVSPAQAARLGDQAPAGAQVDRAARTITFTTRTVRMVVLASPSMPAENFRIAGLTNPAITVPAGAHVTIELINADADMAHGLVITASHDLSSPMPMMTARPAFPGAALWFLGKPTVAGMHAGTLAFTASGPGSYRYLCPVPGHAEEGMAGVFTVASST